MDVHALDDAGDTLLIHHRLSRSLTRFDVASQTVDGRIDLGPDSTGALLGASICWIQGTREALVLDPGRQLLFRVDASSMSLIAEASLSVRQGRSLAVTGDGAHCAVLGLDSGRRTVAIVDTATMTEERLISVDSFGSGTPSAISTIWITPDDQQAVVVGLDPSFPGQQSLLAFSLTTGALMASAALPPSNSPISAVAQSGDRST